MTTKDNDELRQKIDDIVFRCFAQGQYWGSLNKDPEAFDEDYRPENPIDRTEAVKAIEHLITTHTLRALERARMWEQYAGDYDKRYYDIKLWSGEVYENCWPNANTFHEGVIGKLIEGKDVAYVRPSQTPQLNHQKSQKEGE